MRLSIINETTATDINIHQYILDNFNIDIDKTPKLGSGTYATVYDAGKYAIKITTDFNDFKNIIRAKKLNNPNIINVYKTSKIGRYYILLVDKIDGKNADYSTSEWHALIYGDSSIEELKDASKNIFKQEGIRAKILKYHRKGPEELQKLSELFKAIYMLFNIGIELDDFSDNIMDNGSKYIIIDLGM